MTNTIIIGVSGKKQSGKSSLCDYFKYTLGENEVKIYALADCLKTFCVDVLGLTHQQCYGSDEDKNSLTEYTWEYFGSKEKTGFISARELLQIFGTDICRNKFSPNIWTNATLRKIKKEHSNIALISDVRFSSEVEKIMKQPNSYMIRLKRNIYEKQMKDIHLILIKKQLKLLRLYMYLVS